MKSSLTLATLIALGAAAYAPLPSMAQGNLEVYIGTAPPAPVYERIPAVRRGYVWAPGYWEWRGHRHFWVPGNYVVERPGYVYAPPAWHQRGGRWYMSQGNWSPRDRYYANNDRYYGPDRYRGPDRGWNDRGYRDHRGGYGGNYGGNHGRNEGRRDYDRDGVPNRYDRDRDNDGVANRYDRDRDGDGIRNRRDHNPDNPYRR